MPTIQLYMTNRGIINGCLPWSSIIQEMGLYQNPLPLAKGFDPSLLVEADFSGYSRFSFVTGDWSAPPVIDSDGNATVTYPEVTFTKTGASANPEIWGFFYAGPLGVLILFAQEFAAAPYPMVADGDLIRLTPKFSVSNPILP